MRPTSKIILGIILSIFIISLLFITGFSFSERRNFTNTHSNVISIPQDNPIGIDVASHRVIVLEAESAENEGKINYGFSYEHCSLNLNPTAPKEESKLFIPEALDGYIAAKTNRDTLKILIKVDELRKKYGEEGNKYIHFLGVNIDLHTSNVNVINKVLGFPTEVRNIETDSIRIVSNGNILIESCKAMVIDPVMDESYRKLNVKNSIAQTIHLDLDRIRNWNMEGCDIEVQNLTGSGKHNIIQHRNEKIKINWYPKNENAELNIKVPGDTVQIVFQ